MYACFPHLFIYSLSRSLGLTETSSVNDPKVQENSFIQPYRICKRSYSPVTGPCKFIFIYIHIYHPFCRRYNPYPYGYQPYPMWGILRFIVFARCARELGEEDTRRGSGADVRNPTAEDDSKKKTGWWFQIFFIFTPTWGNDPIWLIFLKWVETTN